MPTHVFVLVQLRRLLLDMLATPRLSNQQKDLEILLLRHQLRILQHKLPRSPRIPVWDKGVLVVLAAQQKCSWNEALSLLTKRNVTGRPASRH